MESSFQSNEAMPPTNSGGSQSSVKIKKSRLRVPTVCSVCRRRKMKCDKAKPHCSSCVKNNTTHLCVYEEQPWASNNEIQKLKDQIYALQNQNSELKNLLTKRNESTDNTNENLIIPDETTVDPILELTRDFNVLVLKESKMAHFGSTSFMAVVTNDPILREMFKKYLQAQNWGINFNKFFLYDQGIISSTVGTCQTMNLYQRGSVFETDLNHNHRGLIKKINEFLPNREIIMDLIDHFFSESYVFVPFIDETSFRKNMESLISVNSDGKAILVVSNGALFVSVALLLTVLRFAFITLPIRKNETANLSFKAQKILSSGVSIDPSYIEYAKACLGNAGALRKPTLKHIQALLILRLYRSYAPEDADESTDSTIFLALIVQMAKMHGLHRDPGTFSLVIDHATANIWRKMWAQLMYLDAIQAYTFGCPLIIDDEYDTMLPIPNSNDSALERNSIEWLRKVHEVTMLYREVVKVTSKIKDPPKRSDIENTLKQVEFAIQRFSDIVELTNTVNDGFLRKVTKLKDLILKSNLYTLHSCTYYILALTCGTEELRLAQIYTKKAAESGFINFRFFTQYASNLKYYNQGLHFESFISSCVFELSKRTMQIIISFCLRDLLGLIDLSKSFENCFFSDGIGLLDWIKPISPDISSGDQSIIILISFNEIVSRLQHRYFICWRTVHFLKMFFDNLKGQFPGKFESLKKIMQEHNQVSNSPDNDVFASVPTPVVEEIAEPTKFWDSLVDAAGQSKFDYLSADFEKFKDIGDPFFNEGGLTASSAFTFQDYNSLLETNLLSTSNDSANPLGGSIPSPSTLFSNPNEFNNIFGGNMNSNSISTSDGISPNTDPNSDTQAQSVNDGSSFNQVNLPEIEIQNETQKGTSSMLNNPVFEEHELALQVAKSMFGGSEAFDNDYI